ncbi:MAG: starch-binding protein [Paludibacteraceae bacterium]|nr:starch-binding protein [Paludibacteraceae bacterium]
MRKFISLMMVLFTATSVTFASEGGKITPSKASFGPTETVTLTYDGTGTNFANWEPKCFVHAWLVAAEGQTFSKNYGTDWASCNGDADYAALEAKLKMTFVSKGVYTIDMNIKDFFNVAEADLAKIGKLGIIVRAQYEGDNNKTEDMFLNVGSEQEVTLYFVKPDDWDGVMAYVYVNGGYYKDYPGEEMVKTDKKLKGKDVYSYTFPEKYNMIGFVSKDGERSTGNYAWNTTIPYYYDDGDGYAGNNWWAEDDLVDQMTVYFFNSLDWAKVNTFVWPESGNAYKNWPGQAAKKETEQIHGKDVYAYSFPVTYVNVIFNNGDKQTVDLKWDADKPYFVPGETEDGKYKGTWYAKADIPAPEVPAKYYVTGDTALVVDAGVDKMLAWKPEAIKSEKDTCVLTLKKDQDYKLKVVAGGKWLGFDKLSKDIAGLTADNDGNINFKLNTAGDVKVVFIAAEKDTTFELLGDFYVAPVAKYYVVGNAEAFGGWKTFVPVYEDVFEVKDLAAGDYMFRLAMKDQDWDDKSHGFAQLTVKPEGVSGNDDNNICFTLKEKSDLKVTYKVEEEKVTFTVEAKFYVPEKKDLYLVPNTWAIDDAKIAAWVWSKDGSLSEFTSFFAPKSEKNDTLVAKVNADADSIIFVRFNSTATEPKWNGGEGYQWNQTRDDSIQWEKGIFTIIGCEGYYCDGTWDVYVPEVPGKFYITGDSALVVDAGLEKAQAWNPAAIKSISDTLVLTLKAGVAYQMALTVDGTWNTKKTFEDLTKPVTEGLSDEDGDNHNIGFTLNKDGEVKVVYFVEEEKVTFKVLGDFYVAPTAKYYVVGNAEAFGGWKTFVPVYEDVFEVKDLAAGDYMFRLAMKDQDWEDKSHGFAQLTVKPEGVSGNDDNNICFTLKEKSDLKVTYKVEDEKVTFTVEAKFYVPEKKDLYLVPNTWAIDDAKIAAWVWNKEGSLSEFTAFFAPKSEKNDTLVAKVNAAADSIIFVRFNSTATEPKWNGGEGYQWNQTRDDSIQWEKGIFTIIGCEGYYCDGTWDVYVPEVPAKYYVTGDTALVVAAGVDKMKAWQPNAIKSEADTLELNLAAGDYVLKLTLDGTWAEGKARGYSNLTAPAAEGLSADKDDNICFKLTEAGIVKVIYFVAEEKETFKLEGKFYVAPVEKKYYAKNNWDAGSEWYWKEMTKDDEDSYSLQAIFGGTGVNINTAESEAGQLWFEAKDIDAFLNVEDLPATTLEAKDTVIFFFTPSEEMLAALVIGKYVPATPTLADGFYLVGTFNGVDAWNLSDLTADKLFKATDVEGQYSIDVTLMDGDHFKAIKVEKDAIIQWYPDGTDNDYVVDASHAGQKTIYFRPSFWQDWNGHFYVAPNGGDAINNINATKAVKVLRDGQIMIIKGNKTFNVLGAEIR